MLKLVQFKALKGERSSAVHCMELEAWLRMTQIPYEVEHGIFGSGPKKKLPYIVDDGVEIGDVSFIAAHLKKTRGVDPDAHLTKVERGIAHAYRRMFKEHLYWALTTHAWGMDSNWDFYKKVMIRNVGDAIPEAQRDSWAEGFRAMVKEQLYQVGMGRHTMEEVSELGIADVTAIVDFLADKPFLMGEKVCSVDATLCGLLAPMGHCMESPILDFILKNEALMAYLHRLQQTFFPEDTAGWEHICRTERLFTV